MAVFDAEVPGQTAAPAEELRVRSRPGQQLLIGRVAEDRRLVTMRLHERLDAGQVRQLGADAQQILGQRLHPVGHSVRRLIGDEFERIVLQRRQARGFDADDRHIVGGVESRDRLRQVRLRRIELTGGDERQTAAHGLIDHPHMHTGLLEHRDGRGEDARSEMVRPGIGEQHDFCIRPQRSRGR